MPRAKSTTLTDAELLIMDALWFLGEGSVKDVGEYLAGQDKDLAYNTVLTMLRILNQKGYLDYRKEGRAHIYIPLIDRSEARTGVLRHLLNRFFNGSPSLLIQNLLADETLSEDELRKLKADLASRREEQ